jgi:hypothetical protein
VALPRIGFNEGSLLRRTLLHVGTFVLGSAAFIGLVSFVLVSVARGVVAPRADVATTEDPALALASARAPAAPLPRPGRFGGKRAVPAPVPAAAPSKDD